MPEGMVMKFLYRIMVVLAFYDLCAFCLKESWYSLSTVLIVLFFVSVWMMMFTSLTKLVILILELISGKILREDGVA